MIDLGNYTFSGKAIVNRYKVNKEPIPRWMTVLRGVSIRSSKIKRCREVLQRLERGSKFRAYFEQETTELPQFYIHRIRKDLGALWEWLPDGALHHDPNAYLKSEQVNNTEVVALKKLEHR